MSALTTQWLPPPDAGGPISCATCGCRLVQAGDSGAWVHYPSATPGQDARGCRPACVDQAHDTTGQPVADLLIS
jgi:hypothetical protein